MKNREAAILDGKCYNFALGFVNERQVKDGKVNPSEAITLSSRLSKEIKKVVSRFFSKRPQKI